MRSATSSAATSTTRSVRSRCRVRASRPSTRSVPASATSGSIPKRFQRAERSREPERGVAPEVRPLGQRRLREDAISVCPKVDNNTFMASHATRPGLQPEPGRSGVPRLRPRASATPTPAVSARICTATAAACPAQTVPGVVTEGVQRFTGTATRQLASVRVDAERRHVGVDLADRDDHYLPLQRVPAVRHRPARCRPVNRRNNRNFSVEGQTATAAVERTWVEPQDDGRRRLHEHRERLAPRRAERPAAGRAEASDRRAAVRAGNRRTAARRSVSTCRSRLRCAIACSSRRPFARTRTARSARTSSASSIRR